MAVVALRPESRLVRPPLPQAQPPRAEAAATALRALQRAVRRHDAAGAALLGADSTASRVLGALADNARLLGVQGFALRYVDATSATSPQGRWSAAVDTTWRFAGFDAAPANAEVRIGFAWEGSRAEISSVGGGGLRSPVWMSGPLAVRRTPTTLTLVAGSRRQLAAVSRRAEAAVPVVRRVLFGWRPRLVVEVPASEPALDQTLGAGPRTYAAIAAVTTSVDGSQAPGSPVHVFVNPDVYRGLRPTGAQVVMSHEAAHVATGAERSTAPLWLVEGFADYVALRDVDLPLSTTAGQIIAQVRRTGAPGRLPGTAEFSASRSHLGAAYESAWLACRVLALRGGEQRLVGFYRAVDSGVALGAALRRQFGWSVPDLVAAWRAELQRLARADAG